MMAGDQRHGNFNQGSNTGLMSASLANSAQRNVACFKDFNTSDATTPVCRSSGATSGMKSMAGPQRFAETGGHYRPTTYYDYCYSGNDGINFRRTNRGYSYVGAGSEIPFSAFLSVPYATGSLVGQCIGQQSHLSSMGYPQPPVSYGSDALPFIKKSSGVSGRPQSLNSIKMSGFDANASKFRVDSRSDFPTASSNYEATLHTPAPKPSDKEPQLGYCYKSSGFVDGCYPVRKVSSFSNQVQVPVTHNASLSYRPNNQTWIGSDRYSFGEKINRDMDFEAARELNRGPRALRGRTLSNSSTDNDQLGTRVRRERYNSQDLRTAYDNAKFFVIKSYSEDDIHKSIKYDVWASTPNGNRKLDEAFQDAETKSNETGTSCPIFLFFSVNTSGQFVGLAEMVGRVDFKKDMDFWQQDKWNGFFPVKWHIIKDIPNNTLRHIILENNDHRPVTYTRDTQEVGLKQGLEMLNIFKSYREDTSILDDFSLYEEREKSLLAKRSNKIASSEVELYRSEIPQNSLEAGLMKGEHARTRRLSDSEAESLITLAKNLSLNSNAPKSYPGRS